MILVTGATGTIGSEVARRLPSDRPSRVFTKDPRRVSLAEHTEIRAGDYQDRDALVRAMKGVDSVFVVTNRVAGDDDLRIVEAARSAGVRHLVKLSAAAVTDPEANDRITQWQRTTEDAIRSSGLEWTILRPRSFMSNALSWAPTIRAEAVVRALYGTSANACIDPRDIADVAVRVLTEGGHAGQAYTLTGPQAVTAVQQTQWLSQVLGRPLKFEELSPEEARAQWSKHLPEPVVQALAVSAERQRAGAKTRVEHTVFEVTGQPARHFGTWATSAAHAFA